MLLACKSYNSKSQSLYAHNRLLCNKAIGSRLQFVINVADFYSTYISTVHTLGLPVTKSCETAGVNCSFRFVGD